MVVSENISIYFPNSFLIPCFFQVHVSLQHVEIVQFKVKTNVRGEKKGKHTYLIVFKWRYRSLVQILKTYGNSL